MVLSDGFERVSRLPTRAIARVPSLSKAGERSAAGRLPRSAGLRAWSDLAAFRVRFAFYVFDEQKAGFREDQPRDDRGRWSGGAGAGTVSERVGVEPRVRGGHHYVPQSVFNSPEFDLPADARRVLDRLVTGRLPSGSHAFTPEHRTYNAVIEEYFRRYLRDRAIVGSRMTTNQALAFGLEVLRSEDPRISNFNRNMIRYRLLYIIGAFSFRGSD